MNTDRKKEGLIKKIIWRIVLFIIFLLLPSFIMYKNEVTGLRTSYIFLLGFILYGFQIPIHELGHYLTAKHYLKKKNIDIHCYINLNCTYCEDWRVFTEKENRNILLNGPGIRIIYQLIIMIPFISNSIIVKAGIFSIMIDILFNLLPIRKGADGYKIKNLEALYDEETKEENKSLHYICVRIGYFCILVSPIILYCVNRAINM